MSCVCGTRLGALKGGAEAARVEVVGNAELGSHLLQRRRPRRARVPRERAHPVLTARERLAAEGHALEGWRGGADEEWERCGRGAHALASHRCDARRDSARRDSARRVQGAEQGEKTVQHWRRRAA